jgi:hypothetical protein
VIDRSKSMREQDRFDDARRELKRLLESMPDGSLVNVIFFGWTQNCFAKSPRTLDAQSRRELETFIDRCSLESGTDLCAALEKALTMVGNPDTGRLHEDGVDTIVVLSDGNATVGKIIDDDLIARVITRRAHFLRPVFHSVSLASDSKSLRLLAERSGGRVPRQVEIISGGKLLPRVIRDMRLRLYLGILLGTLGLVAAGNLPSAPLRRGARSARSSRSSRRTGSRSSSPTRARSGVSPAKAA